VDDNEAGTTAPAPLLAEDEATVVVCEDVSVLLHAPQPANVKEQRTKIAREIVRGVDVETEIVVTASRTLQTTQP
jgi:hypothetical protein